MIVDPTTGISLPPHVLQIVETLEFAEAAYNFLCKSFLIRKSTNALGNTNNIVVK